MEFKCKTLVSEVARTHKPLGVVVQGVMSQALLALLLLAATAMAADTSQILQQCRNLSLAEDDIHNCLDNYLDAMDENLASIGDLIRSELSVSSADAASLQAYEASQQAFENYRATNCLWYLEFSGAAAEAEQIAKNCLASMSEQRLTELQLLLRSQTARDLVSGYYVYGAERNTFQACGSDQRLWVEGGNVVVSELQQLYLSKANADLQVMFVELGGAVADEAIDTFAGHDGVFNLETVATLRSPVDSDCAIPRATALLAEQQPQAEVSATVQAASETPAAEETPVDEPVQTLVAYFGDWIARCEQLGSSYGCVLSINMTPSGATDQQDSAKLAITRRSDERTVVDVDIPLGLVPELDDIEKVHWNVDSVKFGALLHSRLESRGPGGAETHVRQALRERWFIRDELLPVMRKGRELSLVLLPDNDRELVLSATLNGLTRALEFADDFTAAESEI